MDNQTESYIVLKPIAERFSRVASSITDDEIESLIKSEMRDQLKKIDFKFEVQAIISEYIDDHEDYIIGLFKEELKNKFQ
jgi:hypothetical protein